MPGIVYTNYRQSLVITGGRLLQWKSCELVGIGVITDTYSRNKRESLMIYLSADSCIWLVTRDSKVHFTPAQLFILLWGINWKLPERTALLQTQQNTIYQIAEYNRQKDLLAKLQRMQFGKSSEKLRAKTERQIQEVQERISTLREK